MEHGVEVVVVITAGTGGGSGVRSDGLFCILDLFAMSSTETNQTYNRQNQRARLRYDANLVDGNREVGIPSLYSDV